MSSLSPRADTCESGNTYNGEYLGARISAVFVLLGVSAIGSFFPLVAKQCPWIKLPPWVFFGTKYVGTGVIVATGFVHLLAEAHEALTNPCLGPPFDYPWTEGIALMGVFLIFFMDLIAHRKLEQKEAEWAERQECIEMAQASEKEFPIIKTTEENTYQQILNTLFLEFGIVFHSVFVGLSLAIAGDQFKSLYVAIAFHQLLEGLGLGTRFATTPWPEKKWYVPWCLSLAYTLTTPIAIAIGIGVRKSYPPNSRRALITTGVFDALCGGVLIYNSLVELMAYDFFFSPDFKGKNGMANTIKAYILLSIGAGIMAVIGKWA
ncbi:ZIP zinc/iron transport family [Suhomyces tanzawaensis NRRL Y-17324]|uniref:ZIP zinc/iron transport family n=1 Tax=Suhomyces tanzawaensis NRRL Y-17324 TaxID=984487 RepID=A0A1E4SSI5_9ASCO|nr:ZIP zinc/iron transport family [Suhomyces tanzawaensis NRRL Y-17324]ODV82377.1 ZIP zinc/iron transport family [Suhomyces tanzawaensis NRRL Y-17324]